MQMLYNSDSYAVVQFDVPDDARGAIGPARGGYEIVDKFARKEIFIEGAMAASFKEGVEALIATVAVRRRARRLHRALRRLDAAAAGPALRSARRPRAFARGAHSTRTFT